MKFFVDVLIFRRNTLYVCTKTQMIALHANPTTLRHNLFHTTPRFPSETDVLFLYCITLVIQYKLLSRPLGFEQTKDSFYNSPDFQCLTVLQEGKCNKWCFDSDVLVFEISLEAKYGYESLALVTDWNEYTCSTRPPLRWDQCLTYDFKKHGLCCFEHLG